MRFAVIGAGRAGGSFRSALVATRAEAVAVLGRGDDPADLDPSLDLVIIAVPDRSIAHVAELVPPGPLVVHVSGATGLGPLLAHHDRCGSIHPLLSLPDVVRGARALLDSPHVAIAAPSAEAMAEVQALVDRLGARWFVIDDDRRATYHAAASIAANHLVALLAQIERITKAGAMPLEPFTDMMRDVIGNVENSGASAALTGPVARGDWGTVRAHLAAIDPSEHPLYLELANACATLAGHQLPADLAPAADQSPAAVDPTAAAGPIVREPSDPPPPTEVSS